MSQRPPRLFSRPLLSRPTARLIAGAFGLSGCLLLCASLTAAPHHRQDQAKPTPGQTSAQKYKNIKVLKTLPADQLGPLMHKINTALDVKCDFCHVQGNFASDDKPTKQKARDMIVMTQDLNKKYKTVDKKVTCYTCHHGHPEPEAMAAAGQ